MNIRKLLVVSLSSAVVACGGGGAGSPGASLSAASVTGVVGGTPSALTVGNAPLSITGAVTVNGKSGAVADVQPGSVIVASTAAPSPGATAIRATSTDVRIEVESSIGAIDLTASTITVAGQTVTIDALTRLYAENADRSYTTLTLSDFAVGDYVEVSGSRQANGSILATRVERQRVRAGQPGYSNAELYGAIAGLDTTARTFTIGTLTVNYSGATVQGTLANGTRVEVQGTLAGNVLTATSVEAKRNEGNRGAEIELEGAMTNFDATTTTFTVLNTRVNYANARVRGTLAEGARVNVEGRVDATDATLVIAREVEVGHRRGGDGHANREVKGAVTAVDANLLTLDVGGNGFFLDANTILERNERPITLADVTVGAYVEVKADSTRIQGSRTYATKIEVKNGTPAAGEYEVKGTVTAFTGTAGSRSLTINGVTITPAANATYYGDNDNALTADQFWGTSRLNLVLEVKGTATSATAATGQRFEIED